MNIGSIEPCFASNTENATQMLIEISKSISNVDLLGKKVFDASSSIRHKSKELESEMKSLNNLLEDFRSLDKLRHEEKSL
jgi:methyl-accepting chemotaxis protein